MTIKFKIDGKKVVGEKNQTVLDVAKANGIDIPTLCHHESIPDWGGCRLCIVEITMEKWKGWSRIVTSCLYPVSEGLIVSTNSKRVRENRKLILDMLLARAPDAKLIKNIAKEYGLTKTTLVEGDKKERCILCGLCTRLCSHQESHAISTVCRGPEKEISTYWNGKPEDCIGCLVCAVNCPTDAISYEETSAKRKIWEKTFKMAKCNECGKATKLTEEQVAFYAEKTGLGKEYFESCDKCSRSRTTDTFLKLINDPSIDLEVDWGVEPLPFKPMPEPTEQWKKLQERKKTRR